MNKIKQKIYQIIVDNFAVNEFDITDDANFYTDLGVDSLDFCELMVDIERAFNIVIEDDQYEKLKTVDLLIKFVEQNAVKNGSAMHALQA